MKTSAWWILLSSLVVVGCGQGPPRPRFCAKRCAVAADCCPAGVADCPSAYPRNYECEDGLCVAPHCTTDDHCRGLAALGGPGGAPAGLGSLIGGSSDKLACVSINRRAFCQATCDTDAECGEYGECANRTDDGRRVCSYNLGCSLSRPCLGKLHCVRGGCRCFIDSDCGTNPKVHCIDGACGCGSDVDCQPQLDVCTDDPRFMRPAAAMAGRPSPKP